MIHTFSRNVKWDAPKQGNVDTKGEKEILAVAINCTSSIASPVSTITPTPGTLSLAVARIFMLLLQDMGSSMIASSATESCTLMPPNRNGFVPRSMQSIETDSMA